jgi:hypothetical protein
VSRWRTCNTGRPDECRAATRSGKRYRKFSAAAAAAKGNLEVLRPQRRCIRELDDMVVVLLYPDLTQDAYPVGEFTLRQKRQASSKTTSGEGITGEESIRVMGH